MLVLIGSLLVYGQRFGRFGRTFIDQNNPPATELVIARWRFQGNGRFGNMGWSHNYPYSEQHIAQLISETTGVNVSSTSYQIVDLGTDGVFDHPFTYVSEPGEMALTDLEVENLRQYVNRGGSYSSTILTGPTSSRRCVSNSDEPFQTRSSSR